MRIVDAHVHIFNTPGYVSKLLSAMDHSHIEKACISGIGKFFNCAENDQIKTAFKEHPDRFFGSFFIRPGINTPDDIRAAHSQGFKMLKITLPLKPYDDPDFFPLWQEAEDHKMPVLFHTGVITLLKMPKNEYVSSWYMHPMRLEPIANSFPKLNMIIAHLGVHWNEDAAELIRMRSNVFADLSGGLKGWRLRADKIGMNKWLWWPGAFKKIVFGTDVVFNEISQVLEEDITRLNKFNIDEPTRKLIFSGNVLKMLGEK